MTFFPNFQCQAPCTNKKHPYWRHSAAKWDLMGQGNLFAWNASDMFHSFMRLVSSLWQPYHTHWASNFITSQPR